MSLKKSRYNFFFRSQDGQYLAYNAFSNSFARVSREKYKIIETILRRPDEVAALNGDAESLKADLLKGGFLVDTEIDELEVLKMRNKIGRFTREFFGLTIAPTLDCNFRCTYCFEKKRRETMTEEVIQALLEFTRRNLFKTTEFGVTWFGGEPLLAIDIIERLSHEFSRLCEELAVKFMPRMIITNGYLLSAKNAQRLKDLNITSAQVTLDGPADVHDHRRMLANGAPTFERILENINESKDIINITVRINVDEENLARAPELFELFAKKGLTGKVPYYLGLVSASTDACADISSKCLNVKDFSRAIIDAAWKSGKVESMLNYPITFDFGVCCADKLNSYVVAPSGNLFKCWSETDFSEEKSVGTVFSPDRTPTQIKNLTRYLNWDALSRPKCRSCRYFPICGGGCPYYSLNAQDRCTTWKYYLKEMLRLQDEVMHNKTKEA